MLIFSFSKLVDELSVLFHLYINHEEMKVLVGPVYVENLLFV